MNLPDHTDNTVHTARNHGISVTSLLAYTVAMGACWVIFSGKLEALHLGLGILSVLIGLILAAALQRTYGSSGLPRFGFFLLYPMWLEGQIISASFKTIGLILSRRPIEPTALWASYDDLSVAGITAYTHSITLTPGTVSLYIDTPRKRIMIHALTEDDAAGMQDGVMLKKIRPLFSRQSGNKES